MRAHDMERASPADDGGHMGSYTVPAQMLLSVPEDTRSSETIGNEPFRNQAGNRGLVIFWTAIVALEGLFVLAASWF